MQAPFSLQPRRRGQAKSNTERQREFRKRNPGYYGRLHRKRKERTVVYAAAKRAALTLGLTEATAAAVAWKVCYHQVNLLLAIAQAKRPLMLPAPVETIRIPGVNAIPTRAELAEMEAQRMAA